MALRVHRRDFSSPGTFTEARQSFGTTESGRRPPLSAWCTMYLSEVCDAHRRQEVIRADRVYVCSLFQLSFQHKVGVLYCKAGQSTEEEMYNNESAGPALEEFLDLLGQRVRLKGFTKYRAQLDNKSKTKLNIRTAQGHTLILLSADSVLCFFRAGMFF